MRQELTKENIAYLDQDTTAGLKFLVYCIQYQDSFPKDLKTALNFMSTNFVENAIKFAYFPGEFLAVQKCLQSATEIIQK